MDDLPKHIIILPYYCQEEVNRYLRIAKRLSTFPQPVGGYHFLLASSPKMRPSFELMAAYSKLGNAIPFACPSRVFGYPQGPTAMFWDCMDYLATQYSGKPGFGLWLESDMAPTQPDWINRLSAEWFRGKTVEGAPLSIANTETQPSVGSTPSAVTTPIMMGCFVPEVFKHRIFKGKKRILNAHINGGACYSLDFVKQIPRSARVGVFDMEVFRHAQKSGRVRATRQIAFSTLNRVRRDLMDKSKVLLHGFMQDKDHFINQCCTPISEQEKRSAGWHNLLDQWENLQRKIRVQFVRRGQQSMLENMFLAKRQFDQNQLQLERESVRRSA